MKSRVTDTQRNSARGLGRGRRKQSASLMGWMVRLTGLLLFGAVGAVMGIRFARRSFLRLTEQPWKQDAGRPLRILHVSARYFPYMGGVETHVYEVARRMAAQGQAVTSLSSDVSGELPPSDVIDKVRVERRRAYPPDRDYYFSPGVFLYILRGQWDIIHCQGYHTLIPVLAMLGAWITQTPYVLTFHSGGHSSQVRNRVRGLQLAILRPLLSRASALIAVSQFEKESFSRQLALPVERFHVIPNGAKLPEVPSAIDAQGDVVTVLSVGRLERYKGHHRLIEALPEVLRQFPNVHLRILGKGTYEDELRQMIRRAGLDEHVTVTFVPPEDRTGMAREMMSAGLVVLFSEYEAHPVTVMEAAALKCSILVADTSGLSEIAAKGVARAIPLESTNAELAAAVVEQLRSPLHPPDIELPTWEGCTESLLSLYKDVLDAE